MAINEESGNRYSDPSVKYTIDQHSRESYLSAAGFLSKAEVDVINLQHEYGIYGGEFGEYVIDLCRNVEKPLVSTLLTVLRNPPEKPRWVVSEIARLSETVVVTLESAARLLERNYGVELDKIRVIRHGAALPERPTNQYAKRQLRLQRRAVLSTFGLISPGKGIEYAIESLSYIVKERPDILYLVIGETHPEVRKREGEAYREKLLALAERSRLERHVRFVDRYLREDEISLYLQATDVYLAPYLGKDQVSSGTLTRALGHGKAIVATPTTFAREVLSGKRGLLCKFADARSMADCIERILGDSRLRSELEGNAFKYGQEVGWTRVADQYGEVFRSAIGVQGTLSEAPSVRET